MKEFLKKSIFIKIIIILSFLIPLVFDVRIFLFLLVITFYDQICQNEYLLGFDTAHLFDLMDIDSRRKYYLNNPKARAANQ